MGNILPENAERDLRFEPVATKEGLHINSSTFVNWSEIEKAKLVFYIGFPYISFRRKNSLIGFRTKVPLYLGDFQTFRNQVMASAPWSNSFRQTLSRIERLPTNNFSPRKVFLIIAILLILFLFARTTFTKYLRHKLSPTHSEKSLSE